MAYMKFSKDNDIFLKVDCVEPIYKGESVCVGEPWLEGIKVWIGGHEYFIPCDTYSLEELIAGWEKWKKKKEDEEKKIRVRDEVIMPDGTKYAVTNIRTATSTLAQYTYVDGISKYGAVIRGTSVTNVKKTGVHVDDLDAYLEV